MNRRDNNAFTIIELLVVVSITALLTGILLPVLGKAKQRAREAECISNQRNVVTSVTIFAMDSGDRYPESVATIKTGKKVGKWGWQEPTMMTGRCLANPSQQYRSMGDYLGEYINSTKILQCPSAPEKYEYFRDAWMAGDDWNNPDPEYDVDTLYGSYCFYWSYVGYVDGESEPFKGPRSMTLGYGQSTLMMSDYLGLKHWRNEKRYGEANYEAFGSSHPFEQSSVTPGTHDVSAAFWSRLQTDGRPPLETLSVRVHAAYADGHVRRFSPSEVVPMKVSSTPDGSKPYGSWTPMNPGIFYLPGDAVH